jgi:hypothetical protein
MFRTKPTRTEKLKAQAVLARDQAASTASDLSAVASERLMQVREQATPMATEAAERVREAWGEAREKAAPTAAELAERARPKVEAAQSTLIDSVLPKVGAAIGAASAALAAGADEARDRVRDQAEPRVAHARSSASASSERVRDAYRVLSGEAVAKPVKNGGKGKWLILVGLGAAAVAAVAAYRKQQADDPWTTPYNDSLTRTPSNGSVSSGSGTPVATGSSLKDKAAEKVEQAKEVVGEAAAKAKEKASDLAAKGQSSMADAKDRSGEVTAVDASLDSDAITSDAMDGGTVVPRGRTKSRDELT